MNRLKQVGEAAAFAGSLGAVAARIAVTETAHVVGAAIRRAAVTAETDPIQEMIDGIDRELQEQALWKDHIDAELAMCAAGISSAQQAVRQDRTVKSRLARLPERARPAYLDKAKTAPLKPGERQRAEAQPLALVRHAANLVTRGLRPDTGTHFRTTRDNLALFMTLANTAVPDATVADLSLDPAQTKRLDRAIWSHYESIIE